MGIIVLQLHKRSSYEFRYIQDKYAINFQTNTFALADGTTQSFYSEKWAESITRGFADNPIIIPNELIKSLKNQAENFKNSKFEFSTNPATASLEKDKQLKGATATFIGLQFTEPKKIELISCGDTNFFLLKRNNKIIPFPFTDLDSLDTNKFFINTEQLLNGKIDEAFFYQKTIEYESSDILILATDALSRLFLKKPSTLNELLVIKTFKQLHEYCLKYWKSKELQEDDISAIIIPIKNMKGVKLIHPPKYFSFPKEKQQVFIPTSLEQKIQKNFSVMEMNEIKNQFNGVAQNFYEVKNKLKLHEMLLMVVISLLMVNILLLFFLRPNNTKGDDVKSKNKTENVVIQKFETTIDDLKSEIQSLKSKIIDLTLSKEEQKEEKVEQTKQTQTVSKEEAKKRQEELIKAGYKVTADGIWGAQSEKTWNEYQQKKKVQK